MTDRDTSVQQIRPSLDIRTNDTTPEEKFQNGTLRPLLKLQHPIILASFHAHLQKNHKSFVNLPLKERHDLVASLIRSDVPLRNKLVGMVLGLFTAAEFEEYTSNTAEINRRIISLLVQRIQSSLEP